MPGEIFTKQGSVEKLSQILGPLAVIGVGKK